MSLRCYFSHNSCNSIVINSFAREPSKIQKDKNQKVENLNYLYTKGDINYIQFLDSVSDTLGKVFFMNNGLV